MKPFRCNRQEQDHGYGAGKGTGQRGQRVIELAGRHRVDEAEVVISVPLAHEPQDVAAEAIVDRGIELVAEQPATLWSSVAPNEYGFYSNVNPDRSHPRWSQASERRIGELGRRPTLMFNGYADQVAQLYEGMDLRENY